jgi:hypothetical protein
MGGKSSTSTSSVQVPPEVLAQYQTVTSEANNLMGTDANGNPNTPFKQYSPNTWAFVAPINQQQNAGIAGTNTYANAAQPFYNSAAALTTAGAGPANPGSLNTNQYMSPYMGDVMSTLLASENNQNQIQQSGLAGNAIMSGAFGGDRAGIAAGNLANQENLANNQVNAAALQSGYTQAQNTAAGQQGLALSANQANLARLTGAGAQLGNIGAGAQTAGLQGAQAQLAAGTTQQQTQQAGLSALYNQFLQQQAYPFQTLGELANISEGIGSLSGSTTTTTQPSSFFSDGRLKEDIEPIGETFDGQKIIKFRYKGDKGPKQIGLLAQDVERHHPEAVGLARGFKTVDYDAATKDAAKRGHFRSGGLAASSGGVASFDHAGEGFAAGGATYDPNWLTNLLATQRQMYASMPGANPLMGASPHGGVGGPASSFTPSPVSRMAVASPAAAQPSGASQFNQAAQTAGNIKGLAGNLVGTKDSQGALPWLSKNISSGIDALGTQSAIAGGLADAAAMTPQGMTAAQALAAGIIAEKRGGRVSRDSGGLAGRGTYDNGGDIGGYMAIGEKDQPPPPRALATAQPGKSSGESGLGTLSQLVGTGAGALNLSKGISAGIDALGTQSAIAGGLADAAAMVPQGMTAADALAAGIIALKRGGRASRASGGLAGRGAYFPGGGVGDFLYDDYGYAPAADSKSDNQETSGDNVAPDEERLPVPPPYVAPPADEELNPGIAGARAAVAETKPTQAGVTGEELARGISGLSPLGQWVSSYFSPKSGDGEKDQFGILKSANGDTPGEGAMTGFTPWVAPKKPEGEVAPVAVQSATPAGVKPPALAANTGAQPTKAPANGGEPDERDWMSRNQDWLVPLLTGIGTMAASPSRYLGSAVLQGIGGAAKAYEPTQESIAGQAQTAANTAATYANTTNANALAATKTGYHIYYDSHGIMGQMPIKDYQDAIERGDPNVLSAPPAAAGPNKAPGSARQIPAMPGVNFGPNALTLARSDRMQGPFVQADIDKSNDYQNKVQDSAQNARNNRVFTIQTMNQIGQGTLAGGLNTPGAGGSSRAAIVAIANTIARAANANNGNNYFGTSDTGQQILDKINTFNSNNTVRESDQRAWAAMRANMQANPNRDMNPEAAATIAADLAVSRQRDVDKNAFVQAYRAQGGGLLRQADQAFENDNNWTTKYAKEIDAFRSEMLSKDGAGALALIQKGGLKPSQIDRYFQNKYGISGMSRYFGGS